MNEPTIDFSDVNEGRRAGAEGVEPKPFVTDTYPQALPCDRCGCPTCTQYHVQDEQLCDLCWKAEGPRGRGARCGTD